MAREVREDESMRTLWKISLALSLGILVTAARGEEVVWRAVWRDPREYAC
jgi:hypothetical protein